MFKSLLHPAAAGRSCSSLQTFQALIVGGGCTISRTRLSSNNNNHFLLLNESSSSKKQYNFGNEFSYSLNPKSSSSYSSSPNSTTTSKHHHGHQNCSSIKNSPIDEKEEEAPIIKLQKQANNNKPLPSTTTSGTTTEPPQVLFDSIDISKTTPEEFHTLITTLRNQLKSISPEQYSIALLQKDEIQVNTSTILYCLNAELATIKDFTKTPSTGLLRLSWWKDQVKNALVGLPPRVPVLMALAYMQIHYFNKGITTTTTTTNTTAGVDGTSSSTNSTGSTSGNSNTLKFSHLRNIFKWREVDLKWKQPTTLADIESYSEGVYSTLIMSHLQCSKYRSVHTDHVASHLGRSYGICTLLRSVPHLSEHQSTYLPAQLCAKYGITEDDIYKQQNSHEMEEVVFKVADLAKSHLDLARELADMKDEKTNTLLVNPKAYPLFLTSIVCEVFLEKLEKVNFNVFHPSLGPQQLRFSILFRLGKTSWFGKY